MEERGNLKEARDAQEQRRAGEMAVIYGVVPRLLDEPTNAWANYEKRNWSLIEGLLVAD